jgi:hypothetical protein
MAEGPFSIPGSATITDSMRSFFRGVVWPHTWDRNLVWVFGIALGTVLLHVATGWRYGFDRDELMALDDARHLAWGYVQYPPMLPFFGRLALLLFGTSLVGFRLFAALAQAAALVLTGLMAREMGNDLSTLGANQRRRISDQEETTSERHRSERLNVNSSGVWAAAVAALAGVPFCLGGGALMQYISFDYLCWVLVAYCMVRLLKSEDARWWLGIGAAIGLGLMAKYTMGFFAVGVIAGVLLTGARKYLRSGWFWAGVVMSMVIVAPNLWWQWQRHFVSLDFLRFIHTRDVRLGLTDWFLPGQLELTMLATPLVVAGLWFLLFCEGGKRYRPLAWMYLAPAVLFLVMRGRAYYLAPAYPMLYAAGAVWVEKRLNVGTSEGVNVQEDENRNWKIEIGNSKSENRNAFPSGPWVRVLSGAMWVALILDVGVATAVALPIAPVNSAWWNFASKVDPVFPEEIGWPEFVGTVAGVWDRLPAEERSNVAILAGNYGELGALNLYGGRYGLPQAISGENSTWERGYGGDPDIVIVTGYSQEFLEEHFASVQVGAEAWNRYGVRNEETIEDAKIYVCRGLKENWPEFWVKLRKFG